MDRRDYIVDIAGLEAGPDETGDKAQSRSWIAVHFKCCHAYARLYRNAAGTAYEGRCPRCGAATRAAIGPGGTDQRFFTAE